MMRWIVFIVVFVCLLFLAGIAVAHDSWISHGALRNGAGEWCRGEGDCGTIAPDYVHGVPGGYRVKGVVVIVGATLAANVTQEVDEFVPNAEVQPSPDGAFWHCRRPDGSRRCFFAPPPGS